MQRKEQEQKQNLNLGAGQILNDWLQEFINQLTERLEKMEEVLVIDRIEGEFAVCENRKNGKIKNIPVSELPEGAKEGNVLKWKKDQYIIDTNEQNEIKKRIEQKMKDVWEQ